MNPYERILVSKYAIDITENTRDLIESITGLDLDLFKDEDVDVLLLEVKNGNTEAEITHKDNLYDGNGNSDPEIHWLIG